MINIKSGIVFIGKNMAEKTPEQLRLEAAEQQVLADKAKASLDAEKVNLNKQQSELRSLQAAVVDLGQRVNANNTPQNNQVIANNIVKLQSQIRSLQTAIPQTVARVNNFSTQATNFQTNADNLQSQADEVLNNAIRPPIPAQINTPSEPESQIQVRNIADRFSDNPPIEVDINSPPQTTTINLFDVAPTPEIQAQPIRQPQPQLFNELEDGSTVTINPDGSITSTPSPIIQNDFGSTILGGIATTGLAAGAAIIGGNLLRKAPENIRDTVRAAAITGAVGLANRALFGAKGLTTNKKATQGAQSNNNAANQPALADWRVKLSLAPDQNYLYASPDPGILKPLAATKGVIFPYLPAISINYTASYDPTEITHSNYKIFSYRQSSVDSITISGDFTAQDTNEANYLLAVIHFFRSVTKMFYGKDENPKPGTPPPLCYLTGYGSFQFNEHPLVITNFTYTLPTDVDYIRASYYKPNEPGVTQATNNTPYTPGPREVRLPQYLKPGGVQGPPQWRSAFPTSVEPTYVPTKMAIQLQALPIVTRNDISRKFSLKDYSSGEFYRGGRGKTDGRGIW